MQNDNFDKVKNLLGSLGKLASISWPSKVIATCGMEYSWGDYHTSHFSIDVWQTRQRHLWMAWVSIRKRNLYLNEIVDFRMTERFADQYFDDGITVNVKFYVRAFSQCKESWNKCQWFLLVSNWIKKDTYYGPGGFSLTWAMMDGERHTVYV